MQKFSLAITFLLTFSLSQAQESSNPISSDTIYFGFDQHQLNDAAIKQLESLVDDVKTLDQLSFQIKAFTDNIGSPEYNLQLSKKRAAEVEAYFKATDLYFVEGASEGLGEDNPIADNDSEEGRQINRCAIITIYGQPQMETTEEFTEKGVELDNVLEGVLKDPETGDPVSGEIIVRTKEGADTIKTDDKGRYTLSRPMDQDISIDVFAPGYFYQSIQLKTDEPLEAIELEKAEVGKSARISNLQFLVGEAILLPESQPELEKLLRFMKENDKVNIEIAGHVSGGGNSPEGSVNHTLSIERGKMVYDYLLDNGISSDRMSYQGYSDWERINQNPITQDDHQVNRRVEIKVIENKD